MPPPLTRLMITSALPKLGCVNDVVAAATISRQALWNCGVEKCAAADRYELVWSSEDVDVLLSSAPAGVGSPTPASGPSSWLTGFDGGTSACDGGASPPVDVVTVSPGSNLLPDVMTSSAGA